MSPAHRAKAALQAEGPATLFGVDSTSPLIDVAGNNLGTISAGGLVALAS